MLEVVEHQERAAGAQMIEDALVGVDARDLGQSHRPRQRAHHVVGVEDVLQRDPPHGVEVLGRALGDLERQPRLARAARPRHGDHAGRWPMRSSRTASSSSRPISSVVGDGRLVRIGSSVRGGGNSEGAGAVHDEVKQLPRGDEVLEAVLPE